MKKIKLTVFMSLVLTMLSCGNDDDATTNQPIQQSNIELVRDALTLVNDASNASLILDYYDLSIINQWADASLDIAGFSNLLIERNQQNTTINREIFRIVAEGDLVMTQSRVIIGNDAPLAVASVFRIANNKIVRQWNVRQEVPTPEVSIANGNTLFDGAGDTSIEISESDLERNKQTVRDFFTLGFMQGDAIAMEALFGDEYIQHNPAIENGQDAVLAFIANGGFPVEIKQIAAQGDLVFVLADYSAFQSNIVDIFRLDTNGKIVEHWDIAEAASTNTDFFN